MRVVFWGTPEFATPPLRALLGEGFDVVAVVTQPDRARGRSRSTLVAPPVKRAALEEGIPVLQPERPRGEQFQAQLADLRPTISVVVAYGHILPRSIIELPVQGTVNIHASLLPRWRGAAPIQAALLNGDSETGVSIMRMVPALDAGPVVLRVATPVIDDETYGELALRLSEMGALALIEALALIDMGKAEAEPQAEAEATYAPKIDRRATWIDWSQDALVVSRVIRALDPAPGAVTRLRGADLKLFGAHLAPPTGAHAPGEVVAVDDDGMLVACGTAAVRVTALQPAGSKQGPPIALARGRGLAPGDVLGTGL